MKEFTGFQKIARFSRTVIVTEKIDGTNGIVYNGEDGEFLVGSRNQWITPEKDNYGFATWAYSHRDELQTLGSGQHFGEWWGSGIQRGYGLPKGEKRWSLFNVTRWVLHGQEPKAIPTLDPRVTRMQEVLPARVGLVPELWRGPFDDLHLDQLMESFSSTGSLVSPGFMQPEGVVIFHTAGNVMFKKTFQKDNEGKGA